MLSLKAGYVAVYNEKLTISSTAVNLTSAYIRPQTGDYKNMLCRQIFLTCEDNNIRFLTEGSTATSTTGHKLLKNQSLTITGHNNIRNFNAICISGDGVLIVTYLF